MAFEAPTNPLFHLRFKNFKGMALEASSDRILGFAQSLPPCVACRAQAQKYWSE
jgi:hypothetical protein